MNMERKFSAAFAIGLFLASSGSVGATSAQDAAPFMQVTLRLAPFKGADASETRRRVDAFMAETGFKVLDYQDSEAVREMSGIRVKLDVSKLNDPARAARELARRYPEQVAEARIVRAFEVMRIDSQVSVLKREAAARETRSTAKLEAVSGRLAVLGVGIGTAGSFGRAADGARSAAGEPVRRPASVGADAAGPARRAASLPAAAVAQPLAASVSAAVPPLAPSQVDGGTRSAAEKRGRHYGAVIGAVVTAGLMAYTTAPTFFLASAGTILPGLVLLVVIAGSATYCGYRLGQAAGGWLGKKSAQGR